MCVCVCDEYRWFPDVDQVFPLRRSLHDCESDADEVHDQQRNERK